MARYYTEVTLYVNVTNVREMYKAALDKYLEDCPLSGPDEAVEMLGTEAEPNISGCLRMLFDPGVSPPGTSIQDSACDIVDGDEEDE